MKRALSLILCALMMVSCLAICAFAQEETTEAEGEAEFSTTHIVFDVNLTGKKNLITSVNELKSCQVSKTNEWPGVKIEITGATDPHLNVDYDKYIRVTENQPHNIETTPFVVIKILSDEIYCDDFEIYYCAGEVTQATEDCRLASDYAHDSGDGVLYFVYNLTDLASGALHSLRVDILGGEIDAIMYMTDIALFATEEEALTWCGYYDDAEDDTDATTGEETSDSTTAENETEATTEAKTEATTEAKTEAKSEAAEDGCGGIIGAGLITLSLIALGAVCIKKKD